MTFQFDDSLRGVFDRGSPIMNKYLKEPVGSVAVITGFLDDLRTTTMTWEEINILRNMGWEMQCHQTSNVRVTELSDEELHEMYRTVNRKFTDEGWDVPKITFLHGRVSDERTRLIARQYRKVIFNENPTRTSIDFLDRLGVDYRIISGEMQAESLLNTNKTAVDQLAMGAYDWLIFRGHDIRDAPTEYPNCAYTHYFEDLIKHVATKSNIKLVTIEQGLKLLDAWGRI